MKDFGDMMNQAKALQESLSKVQDEIKRILNQFEPRIDNIAVTVSIVPDSNEMNATIEYDIVGLPTPPQIVDVLLFPARV